MHLSRWYEAGISLVTIIRTKWNELIEKKHELNINEIRMLTLLTILTECAMKGKVLSLLQCDSTQSSLKVSDNIFRINLQLCE